MRLLGAGGAVLAENEFTPEFFTLEEGLDYALFIFNVAPAGLRSVVLVRGNTVLSTLAASATPPGVTIQAPLAGSYSGEITVRWRTDADADGAGLHGAPQCGRRGDVAAGRGCTRRRKSWCWTRRSTPTAPSAG